MLHVPKNRAMVDKKQERRLTLCYFKFQTYNATIIRHRLYILKMKLHKSSDLADFQLSKKGYCPGRRSLHSFAAVQVTSKMTITNKNLINTDIIPSSPTVDGLLKWRLTCLQNKLN